MPWQLLDAPLLTEEDKAIKPELALLVPRIAKDPAGWPTMAAMPDELARMLGVKTAVAGQVVIRPTLEISALQGELATGDTKISDVVIEASSAPSPIDGSDEHKKRQVVPAPH